MTHMKRLGVCVLFLAMLVLGISARWAHATPTTEFWTPATIDVQPYKVWHLGIDNYFTVGRGSGSQIGTGAFATDVGLTVGVLPYEKLNLEVGVDMLEPIDSMVCSGATNNGNVITQCGTVASALSFNFKFGIPEGAIFKGSPGIAAGMLNIGTVHQVTDMNIADLIIGKTIGDLGRVHVGGYLGSSSSALMHENGDLANATKNLGYMVAYDRGFLPVKDKEGNEYSKIGLGADYASGKNYIGGYGVGVAYYFTKDISILTGPVVFNDQVINGRWKWSTQLDINF